MRRTLWVLGLCSLGVSACGKVAEHKWLDKSAKVSCKFAKRCDTSNFYYQYDSLGECIDDTIAGTPDYTLCAYDDKQAKVCIRAMKWSCKKIGDNYEELLERCHDVWACEGDLTTGGTGDTGVLE